jgi:hypothetical protein
MLMELKVSLLCSQEPATPKTHEPIQFQWTVVLAYSKEKLKSDGDKASPWFRTILVVNA